MDVPSQSQGPISWGRAGGYECSTKGDSRFSAFNARMPDGRSIEQHYQCDVKGYDPGGTNWRLGKGRPAIGRQRDLWSEYLGLWATWARLNPDLMQELRDAAQAHGNRLSDCFASTPINQARALANLLNADAAPEAGPDTHDCYHAVKARECACGFCRAAGLPDLLSDEVVSAFFDALEAAAEGPGGRVLLWQEFHTEREQLDVVRTALESARAVMQASRRRRGPGNGQGMVDSFESRHKADHRDPAVAQEWGVWQAAWQAAIAQQAPVGDAGTDQRNRFSCAAIEGDAS